MSRAETMQFIPSTQMGRFTGMGRQYLLPVNLGVVYDEMAF